MKSIRLDIWSREVIKGGLEVWMGMTTVREEDRQGSKDKEGRQKQLDEKRSSMNVTTIVRKTISEGEPHSTA